MYRPARLRSARQAHRLWRLVPDDKTDFADVKLHVLHVPALGYKVVWIGRQGEVLNAMSMR